MMCSRYIFAALLLALSTYSLAVDLRLDGSLGSSYETNALNDPLNEQDDVAMIYGLEFGLEHRGSSFDFGGNYEVSYRDYIDELNEDETLFVGTSNLVWRVQPGFFEWNFSHSRENSRRDVLAVNTPDARENREVISTQPVFFFRKNTSDQIIVSARYVNVNMETAEGNDSERWGGSIGWRRLLSSVSQLSLNTEYSQVDFQAQGADYDMVRVFGDYSAQLRVLDYSIQVGATQVDRDVGSSITAEFFRFEAVVEQRSHQYTLVLLDELTDTSIGLSDVNFALNIDNRTFDEAEIFDGADLLTQKQVQFFYEGNIFCDSCAFAFNIGYLDLDYENTDRQEKSILAGTSLRYGYSKNLDLTLGVNYQDSDVSGAELGLGNNITVNSEELSYNFVIDWRITRRFDMSLALSHVTQESEERALLNYDNDIALLTLTYRIL